MTIKANRVPKGFYREEAFDEKKAAGAKKESSVKKVAGAKKEVAAKKATGKKKMTKK